MKTSEIIKLVEHPGAIGSQHLNDLKECVDQFPYSQTFRFLYLKGLKNVGDLRYEQELRKASLYAMDRASLHQLILMELEEEEATVVAAPEAVEALPVQKDPRPSVQKEERRPASAASTIADIGDLLSEIQALDSNENVREMHGQSLIDDFISSRTEKDDAAIVQGAPQVEPAPLLSEPVDNQEEEASCFTETLAKIYIKQKKFDKAIKIFQQLSLKNPEKSIYFADQIRFFERLIENLNN